MKKKQSQTFEILDHCIACTTCSSVSPNVFKIDQSGDTAIILNQPNCTTTIQKSIFALKSCPVSAIRVQYDNC